MSFPDFRLTYRDSGEPTSGLEPPTCSLRVCCYRVRLVPLRPQKPINRANFAVLEARLVRLVPPNVARVGISVGIKATAQRTIHYRS
jgi:hypothetical protein